MSDNITISTQDHKNFLFCFKRVNDLNILVFLVLLSMTMLCYMKQK